MRLIASPELEWRSAAMAPSEEIWFHRDGSSLAAWCLLTSGRMVDERKLRRRTGGDVQLDKPITSKMTANGRELNVKRLAGAEAAVASAPPPFSGHAPYGSPAGAQEVCPSA